MSKRILLGVDTPMSPATQYALRTVSEFIEQASPRVDLVLLHIIPIPYITSPSLGIYAGQIQTSSVTAEQRIQAEHILRKASIELQKRGLDADHIETLIRLGVPAEGIVRGTGSRRNGRSGSVRHGSALLSTTSLPARDHSARNLALSGFHPELP